MAQQNRSQTLWQRLMSFVGLGRAAVSGEDSKRASNAGVVYDKAIGALQGAVQGPVTYYTIDVASNTALDNFANLVTLPEGIKDRGGFTPIREDIAHLAKSPMLQIKLSAEQATDDIAPIGEALRSLFSSNDDIVTLEELFTMFDLGAFVKMAKLMTGIKVTPDAAALLTLAGSLQRQVDPIALLAHIMGTDTLFQKEVK